jgi:ribonuclease PH
LVKSGELTQSPIRQQIAAISVGLLDAEPVLDLNYIEDVAATTDFNVVMDGSLNLIEIQGTAEEGSFSRHQLNRILDLAEKGIKELMDLQRQVVQAS